MNTDKTELSQKELETLHNDPFYKAYKGYFSGVLRWDKLDDLWLQVTKNKERMWFIYAIGEELPTKPVAMDEVKLFREEI